MGSSSFPHHGLVHCWASARLGWAVDLTRATPAGSWQASSGHGKMTGLSPPDDQQCMLSPLQKPLRPSGGVLAGTPRSWALVARDPMALKLILYVTWVLEAFPSPLQSCAWCEAVTAWHPYLAQQV